MSHLSTTRPEDRSAGSEQARTQTPVSGPAPAGLHRARRVLGLLRMASRLSHRSEERTKRSPSLVGATILLAALAAVLGVQAPASAYTPHSWGSPGTTTTPYTYAASTGYGAGKITVPWRTVYESPRYSNHAQYVCVAANLVTSSGARSWADDDTAKHCAWIGAAASSVAVHGADFTGLIGMNMAIYSVNLRVTWQLSNGAKVGERVYDYDSAKDYRCSTASCAIKNTTWGGGAYVTFTR